MSLLWAVSRSFNRNGLNSLRPIQYFHTTSLATTHVSQTKLASAAGVVETHIDKNERLKRPMSPHITIYKFELPANLSITHRTTGIILASYATILGVAGLTGSVDGLIATIEGWGLPSVLLFLGKYFFALPATFHFYNGLRHLLWDMGKFLTIKEVYSTGYVVIGLSIAAAIVLACL